MSKSVQMMAAVYPDREHAKVTIDMLQQMHRAVTITLLDAAMATKDDQGKIHIEETKELTARKGARRGAIAAGVFGLIFPPSLIASAVAGGAIGALAGRARDTGVKRGRMEEIANQLEPGKAAVIALAEDEWVLPIQQALVGYEGTLITEPIDEETLKMLYEAEALGEVTQGATIAPQVNTAEQGTPHDRLLRVRDGMDVVDAAGEMIGKVAYIQMDDPRAAGSAGGVTAGEAMLLAMGANREPNVPDVLARRLLLTGFIKVQDKRRLRTDFNYYASADEIAGVVGDSVRLTKNRDELITPGG
ncbi:MAG TPA: DUF1269 domain-containing protein [Thermomicrobiales bacterium]|jgi:uncharacterized membrane protein